MYKGLTVIIISLSFFTPAFSQEHRDSTLNESDLIGVWQVGTKVVSSALKANFRFFKNGTYTYYVDGYDDLNPIYSISGSFKLKEKVLYMKIEQYKQLAVFNVTEPNPGFQSGPFVLDGGKLTTVKQTNAEPAPHELELIKGSKGYSRRSITIDGDKYFKIADDPSKFDK